MFAPNPGTFGLIRRKVAFHFSAAARSRQVGRIRRRKIRCFNLPKERKASDVRQTYVNVRNHFLSPIYKRPKILGNRIISAPNPGTFGLIRRKVAFHSFLAVRTVVGENILEVFLAVRTVVGANILGVR